MEVEVEEAAYTDCNNVDAGMETDKVLALDKSTDDEVNTRCEEEVADI